MIKLYDKVIDLITHEECVVVHISELDGDVLYMLEPTDAESIEDLVDRGPEEIRKVEWD